MQEDWLELISDFNSAYALESNRETMRAERIQRVLVMVPKKR